MVTNKHLISLASSYETVIPLLTQQLISHGMVVRQSFDLQTAISVHTGCACPHHGTECCDCQIVVLLVYGEDQGPVSLVVHSQDGTTYLSFVENQIEKEAGLLVEDIFQVISNQIIMDLKINIGVKSDRKRYS